MSSTNYMPYMTYIVPADHARLRKLAKKSKKPMAQLVREAISSKLSNNDPYTTGFNEGIQRAIDTVSAMEVTKMKFPSGLSFSELIENELIKQKMIEAEDGKNTEGST
jgi:predicted DNA-binding protein